MLGYFSKSILLLAYTVIICCVIYPLTLWMIGQVLFPFQANGSMILGSDGKPIGSKLIAQPFTKDEYFQPRPSAASYDAAASSSSSLAPSNYALRDRVARFLAPIATYKTGPKAGKPVGPDIDRWLQEDKFQDKPHIVAQWANLHSSDIQSIFFDLWLQDHPDVDLVNVPGDMVTTSGSGLDPHISLENAKFQLDRVAAKWASDLKRDPSEVKMEIEQILENNASAPFAGLAGEKLVNVFEINLELRKRYGNPALDRAENK